MSLTNMPARHALVVDRRLAMQDIRDVLLRSSEAGDVLFASFALAPYHGAPERYRRKRDLSSIPGDELGAQFLGCI